MASWHVCKSPSLISPTIKMSPTYWSTIIWGWARRYSPKSSCSASSKIVLESLRQTCQSQLSIKAPLYKSCHLKANRSWLLGASGRLKTASFFRSNTVYIVCCGCGEVAQQGALWNGCLPLAYLPPLSPAQADTHWNGLLDQEEGTFHADWQGFSIPASQS